MIHENHNNNTTKKGKWISDKVNYKKTTHHDLLNIVILLAQFLFTKNSLLKGKWRLQMYQCYMHTWKSQTAKLNGETIQGKATDSAKKMNFKATIFQFKKGIFLPSKPLPLFPNTPKDCTNTTKKIDALTPKFAITTQKLQSSRHPPTQPKIS